MPNTCATNIRFFFWIRCVGVCPPGAGDRCTLQYRPKGGAPPNPWKTEPSGRRFRFGRNEEFRCECLRPGG